MTITDIDRITAVQNKLFEVKAWVDETLKILNYVCIDKEHRDFKLTPLSKAAGIYPGQFAEPLMGDQIIAEEVGDAEEEEECSS